MVEHALAARYRSGSEQLLLNLLETIASLRPGFDENIHLLTRTCCDVLGAVSAKYSRSDQGLVVLAGPHLEQHAAGGLAPLELPVVVQGRQMGVLSASFLKSATPGPTELKALELLARAITAEEQRRAWNTERFRAMTERAPDVIYRIEAGPEPRLEYVNSAVSRVIGWSPDELYSTPGLWFDLIHPDDRETVDRLFRGTADYGRPARIRLMHRDKRIVWTEHNLTVERDSEGRVTAVEGVARDVTEQQRTEDEIRYLGYHDELTGLYNRGYFEHAIKHQRESPVYPFSILVADVNGLKMANDAFSHADGDRLLISAGRLLREAVRSHDAVCRTGGDEFGILMPGVDSAEAQQVCIRIREACRNAAPDPIQVSMAVGASTQEDGKTSVHEVLRRAEDSMYRVKLLEKTSAHSAIISSLQKTLSEKSTETEEHAERLRDLCLQMGRVLRLPDHQLSELSLLAILHDLGKVAIPDDILMKPGPLTSEQWDIMRRHPEIGYRIASASPDLLHIANSILSHHERWDGRGYPQGLRGEDIPLASRILAIIDAWDAMVFGRLYKRPTSPEQALSELQRCAGTQFDAHLTTVFSCLLTEPRRTPR